MKKLSPEFRVGIIAIVIIVLFIWLFSFLKGRNLLSSYDHYHIKYENVAGLVPSSPVEISGLKSGLVSSVKLVNDGTGLIDVMVSIEKNYNIPENSIAEITTATLIAGMKIDLILGDSKNILRSGDEIQGRVAVSILDKLDNSLDPVIDRTKGMIGNLDTLLIKLNNLFTADFSTNIDQSAENLEKASGDFRNLLSSNSDDLTELVSNLNKFSQMLGENIDKFDSTIYSVNRISTSISESEIDSTLASLQVSLSRSSDILDKMNKGYGSAGKLFNDDSLYINLTNSLKSLEILLKDIEMHPGKYVHFSIFGNKKE